jgi:hypothetical protein
MKGTGYHSARCPLEWPRRVTGKEGEEVGVDRLAKVTAASYVAEEYQLSLCDVDGHGVEAVGEVSHACSPLGTPLQLFRRSSFVRCAAFCSSFAGVGYAAMQALVSAPLISAPPQSVTPPLPRPTPSTSAPTGCPSTRCSSLLRVLIHAGKCACSSAASCCELNVLVHTADEGQRRAVDILLLPPAILTTLKDRKGDGRVCNQATVHGRRRHNLKAHCVCPGRELLDVNCHAVSP